MKTTYPTDLTDEQWAIVGPLIPPSHGGRPHDAVAGMKLASHLDRTNYPRLRKIWADSKYHNHALHAHIKDNVDGTWELEIVSRPPDKEGWVKLPYRWVAERTFAWLGRYRINSKEYER